ncbi:MAG: tyrosine-type recombinase/integrase [Nanoarchaeota archaeon]
MNKKRNNYHIRYLSFNDLAKLNTYKNLSKRDHLIILLLYHSGCTVNELVNVKIKDINFTNNTLKISKDFSRNKSFRIIYLSKFIIDKISRFINYNDKMNINQNEYLFSTRQSKKISTKRVRQIVEDVFFDLKIKNTTPQILRYTHIAHAYIKGIPIDAIQKQVGLRRSRAIEIFNQLSLETNIEAYKAFDEKA